MLELSMSDKIRRTQFLGREFLTWLMFKAAQGDGVFYDENGKITEISFERALTLDGENPAREMKHHQGGQPNALGRGNAVFAAWEKGQQG